MTLTKAEIIEAVQERLGYTREQSGRMISHVLELMKRTMENGDDILISGFGKFCVKEKNARKGRNPATGDDLILGKRRVVTFKCSQILRERLNGKR